MVNKILCILFFFVFCHAAYADHLPGSLLAKGEPETKLAGIDLKTANLKDVIKLYGKPTRKIKVQNNPTWTGYVWELKQAKIELGVNDLPDNQVDDIYVEGTSSSRVGETGRGLKLGDDINDIKRIYGENFEVQKINSIDKRMEFTGVMSGYKRVTIQWESEEFTLTAGLNKEGKIFALWLILPECYPGPCE